MVKINAREVTVFILIVNIISFVISMSTGKLLGDLSGQLVSINSLFLSLLFFILSLGFLWGCHQLISKIKPLFKVETSNYVGLIIALLSISFIFYVYQTNLFLAGSSERGGGWGSTFYVIMNIDALMMIYLTFRVNDRFRTINMLLWTVSFLQRGWISYLLFIFVSWYFRRKSLGKSNLFLLFIIFPLTFSLPYLDTLKNSIRNSDSVSDVVYFSAEGPYFQIASEAFEKIVSRFQTISHIAYILDNADEINNFKKHLPLQNFYEENLVGLALSKASLVNTATVSSDFLARFISPTLDSSWNVNPSLVGWLYLHDYYYFAPLMWIFLLIFIFHFFKSTLIITENYYASAMSWFLLVLFVLPGWIFQFTTLIISIVIYITLNVTCNYLKYFIKTVLHINENTR
ncbi:oligosaccharide repeat unit polymerase [Aeromonas rivipollensis]